MKRLLIFLYVMTVASSCFSQEVTVCHSHFYSVYSLKTQCPSQVGWTITPSDLGIASREPSWLFVQDVPHPLATANHYDYSRTGYDRGHLCPAQDRSWDINAMRSTFVMSNIAPQVPTLNRGPWKKTEVFCRKAALSFDTIQVVALPIFLKRDTTFIGSHRVAVPHAFIKAAWLPKNDSLIGLWWFWNK